jgi:hypothetical protein
MVRVVVESLSPPTLPYHSFQAASFAVMYTRLFDALRTHNAADAAAALLTAGAGMGVEVISATSASLIRNWLSDAWGKLSDELSAKSSADQIVSFGFWGVYLNATRAFVLRNDTIRPSAEVENIKNESRFMVLQQFLFLHQNLDRIPECGHQTDVAQIDQLVCRLISDSFPENCNVSQELVEQSFAIFSLSSHLTTMTKRVAFIVLDRYHTLEHIAILTELIADEQKRQDQQQDDTGDFTEVGGANITTAIFPISFLTQLRCDHVQRKARKRVWNMNEAIVGDNEEEVMGWMVMWTIVLRFQDRVQQCNPALAQDLASGIASDGKFFSFFDLLVTHLPLEAGAVSLPAASRKNIISAWLSCSHFDDMKQVTVAFACELFEDSLRHFPALSRSWWSQCTNKKLLADLSAYTAKNVTPLLIRSEVDSINRGQHTTDRLVIRASAVTGEVTAIYERGDDAVLEVILTMPLNFPLAPVQISMGRKDGLTDTRARKWMLLMTRLLHAQNGTMVEAISLWRENVEKMFEGVEDCPICYATIHLTTHALPRKQCRTCKYKFHNACLVKWFATSHKSVCPLCQTSFI